MSTFTFILPSTSTPAISPAEPAAPNAPIDHVAAGLSRLYMQFRKPKIIELLTMYLERWNQLEAVCQDLRTMRNIYNAVGAQEDNIGKKVLQARNGLDNDTYRLYLFARIATNNSDGGIEDFIKIAKLIINDDAAYIKIEQQAIATVLVQIRNFITPDALANVLIDLLRQSPVAAVRLRLEFSSVTSGLTFTYGTPPTYGTATYGGSLE